MYLICGEALIDFVARGNAAPALQFDAAIGGSPLNVAVGLRRLGCKTAFFAGLSTDFLGQRLADFIAQEGIETDYIRRLNNPTTLSLAQLNLDGAPQYAFYGADAADCALTTDDVPADLRAIDGLHFGSYSAAVRPAADCMLALARAAGERFLSYDVNVRPNIEPDAAVWRARLDEYVGLADYVKLSMEDFAHLHPGGDAAAAAGEWLQRGRLQLVVITDGEWAVRAWHRRGFMVEVAAPKVESMVDSVGAGDAFQAGMLSRLQASRKRLAEVSADDLRGMLGFAGECAAWTCGRRGAEMVRR